MLERRVVRDTRCLVSFIAAEQSGSSCPTCCLPSRPARCHDAPVTNTYGDGTANEALRHWTIVVPAKGGINAKTRLAELDDTLRQSIAEAMALDVVTAARQATRVKRVIVVTSYPALIDGVRRLGADVVPDPGAGLNVAIAAAAAPSPWAVVLGDLPTLTPSALDAILQDAENYDACFVQDDAGDGTTMVAAQHEVATHFGPHSATKHLDAGFVRLQNTPLLARSDVDTVLDLRAARVLGLGTHTAAAVKTLF